MKTHFLSIQYVLAFCPLFVIFPFRDFPLSRSIELDLCSRPDVELISSNLCVVWSCTIIADVRFHHVVIVVHKILVQTVDGHMTLAKDEARRL